MSSSKSSPKQDGKISFKPVSPFELFYQLTYMSAMTAAGITRSKAFELAAQSNNAAAAYFAAINTLVDEFRLDYPEACRRVGNKAKSDNMKSFLLRLSDALRSGEPLADFMAREAGVQGSDYENQYERDLEALKQWTNAFSSIVISVALIVIVQVISSMLYSMDIQMMLGLVFSGVMISGIGSWIIFRSAPQETLIVPLAKGSAEQRRVLMLTRLLVPGSLIAGSIFYMLEFQTGWALIIVSAIMLPIGITAMISDGKTSKKDVEFSTFLRSTGGMATSSGTTLKEALKRVDLSSFPTLEPDIQRLSTSLEARVAPDVCWHRFGIESGSRLISEVADIFYGGVKIGGDPERVGFLCSLFTAKTAQLRAKRRLITRTFAALTTVMQGVIAGLMVFVLSIVENFAEMVQELMPTSAAATQGQQNLSLGMAEFTPGELEFLATLTFSMILLMAAVGAMTVIFSDGGTRLKVSFYLALTVFISGVCYLVVPPMVDSILAI